MEKDLIGRLVSLLAPGQISENFEIVRIEETEKKIIIYFDEKEELVPDVLTGKDVVLNGYLNPVELQTFPLKDKAVYLLVRRRRWKERGEKEESFSNDYDLYRKGMKTTNEFGIFLKEELGLSTAEYNKFWESLTS
ncbi:MAG: hypothetical protein KKF21_00900 [Bacteroidetes bacterium]|nr:hypothetical protein [Bacteroidota bacterium]